jgi:protoporphyrinogen/coproporphyrinogen III oxidase
MKRSRVAVIGGGLAGLCAARALERRGHAVAVFEAAAQLGGQIRTETRDGVLVEHGAEGFVARSEAVPRLAHALGIGGELCTQLTTRSLIYAQGQLRELGAGEAAQLLGFQVAKEDFGQGMRSFTGGMAALTRALERALAANVELRTDFAAHKLSRRTKSYVIESGDGASYEAERVVVATSAKHAARFLSGLFGPAASGLADSARTLSSVCVSLAYAREAISHPLDATGFVVAVDERQHDIRACAFVDSKLPGRAPSGKALLRVFFRPSAEQLTLSTDASFVASAGALVARVLGASAAAEHSWVARWPDALPVFDDAHRASVAALETALSGSGVTLAGSAFHGAGIDAAVRSAQGVVERL